MTAEEIEPVTPDRYVQFMVERSSSLEFILGLVERERDKQLSHFEALDYKAGIALGFAGLLVALAPDVEGPFLLVGTVAAALAASLGLWTFWPRGLPILEATQLREYLTADRSFSQLTVLDTLEIMIAEQGRVLRVRTDRLKWALIALAVATMSFAVGLLAEALWR